MNRDIPKSLYKYCAPERIDVLLNASIRYTPPNEFNDPFEVKPRIGSLGLSGRELSEAVADALENNRDAIVKESVRFGFDGDSSGIALQQIQDNSDKYADTLSKNWPEWGCEITDSLGRVISQHLGVLCLAEVPDSLLMWAHYSGGHSGFAIEFDSKNDYFDQRISAEDELQYLRRVVYRDGRPEVNAVDFSEIDLLYTKSAHWDYEREWRIIRPLVSCDANPEPNVHLFNFPPESVKSLVLGARISRSTEESLVELINMDERYRHVKLKRAVPDRAHFLLNIEDVPL